MFVSEGAVHERLGAAAVTSGRQATRENSGLHRRPTASAGPVLVAASVLLLLPRLAAAADPPGIGWFAHVGVLTSAVREQSALREGTASRGIGINADGGVIALALTAGVGIQGESVSDQSPYTIWTDSGSVDSHCLLTGMVAFVGLRTPAIPVGGGASVRVGVNKGHLKAFAERGVNRIGEAVCEDCPSEPLGFKGGDYLESYLVIQRANGARYLIAYRKYEADSDFRSALVVGVGHSCRQTAQPWNATDEVLSI